MQRLHRMYIYVVLELPKESDLLLDLPELLHLDSWIRY